MIGSAVREPATKIVNEAAITAPPLFVTSASLFGVSFQNWVYILTAIFTMFQILRLIPKMYGCVVCFYKARWSCRRTCKMG